MSDRSDPHSTIPSVAWHARSAGEVLAQQASSAEGLSAADAAERHRRHGPNALPEPPRRSALARFLTQFNNLLIYVLLAAAVVAGLLGHGVDAVVILLVVLINAAIGFVQEGRAEQSLEAIRNMIAPRASAIRDGRRITLDSAELVPGDIVLIEAGDRVPADLRLLRARNLRVDEAILTGESIAVEKSTAPVAEIAGLGDRLCMAYSGTMVAAGQGQGVVVGIGSRTEIGRISSLIRRVTTLETPLLRQMNRFGRQLSLAILAVAALVFAFAVLLRGYSASEAFMAMVGLVVAAIPEGLPAVMTITLAIGVQRMAARKAIIRRLPAVETLGSVSVICSDKTGTLTRNEMTVQAVVTAGRVYDVGGVGYEPRGGFRRDRIDLDPAADGRLREIARAALLCNDAQLRQIETRWIVDGDPMEGALVSLAVKAGFDAELDRRRYPRNDEIPFDAQHRFMATLHHSHEDGHWVCLKGAPERVIEMCRVQRSAAGATEAIDREWWTAQIEAQAGAGRRVLALAIKPMPDGASELRFADLGDGLVLLGLVGLIDPPREEAIEAVRACREAGVAVKMITGDHALTASAIASQLGLPQSGSVITGAMLDEIDDEHLRTRVREVSVFARTTPEHKLRLVTALQAHGAVVAMTGDGVNDAPALKRADVGVAMGLKGTEAAKEASEMVLADDNFASIVAAVREGRTVYDNLKKVIAWTLPTNGGEAMAIIVAILFGLALPVTPLQILWINMVTAVALGLTLAFEPTEPGAMRRPPRTASEPLLSAFLLWRIILVSLLFVTGAFGLFFWMLDRGESLESARTAVVNGIVVMEIFYLFSVRYVHGTSLSWRGALGTPAVLTGVGVVVVAQLALTWLPWLQRAFATRPLDLAACAAVLGVGVALLAALEIEKWIGRRLGARERMLTRT